MSSPLRILELRLSVIWTETFPTLLAGAAPGAPMAFLAQPADFANRYDQIRQQMIALDQQWQDQSFQLQLTYSDPKVLAARRAELLYQFDQQLATPNTLTPPWPWIGRKYAHHFWQYYLENTEPNALTGARAWQFVVPLRLHIPVRIGSPWPAGGPKCRVMLDGLIYPHGVAVIVMPRLLFKQQTDGTPGGTVEPGLSPTRMMEYALDACKNLSFPVVLPNGATDRMRLDILAKTLLDYLRDQVLGDHSPQGNRPSSPLTVATVIQGRGGDPTIPIPANSDLHKVLEGLCSWSSSWAVQTRLKPLAEADLLVNNSIPGHIVYHLRNGRAVWMPRYFSSASTRDQHTLTCYHRNLSLVMLQTEMLAQIEVMYTDYLDRGETPPDALKDLARCAAIRLGYMYAAYKKGNRKYTYNSASPRAYLDENGYVPIINQARQTFPNMTPLSYTKW